MRVVIQRVTSAMVTNETEEVSEIKHGLLVLLGIETNDDEEDVKYLSNKIARLRIFDDKDGIMNLSVVDIKGQLLVVSQFTLHAETQRGNRPSYIKAARPEIAIPLYHSFMEKMKVDTGLEVKAGWFGAHMKITLVNDGPVTIIMDSKKT